MVHPEPGFEAMIFYSLSRLSLIYRLQKSSVKCVTMPVKQQITAILF